MDIYIILAFLFGSISIIVWVFLVFSVNGFERYRSVFTEQAASKFENMFLFVDAKRIFFINIVSLIGVPIVVYLTTDSVFYVFVSLIAVLALPKITLYRLESRRKVEFVRALPDALSQIASAMNAGQTFSSAMETMVHENKGPISQEFSLVLREQRLGKPLAEALENLGERVQAEELDLVVTATQIANEVGGNLSEIFQRLSATLRRKLEMEGKIKALTSQGVLQGWVVGMLPLFIIGALYFVDRDNISPIFSSLLGWIFLGVIAVNEIIGGMLIRKIVTIDI
jgi:tight adherence protein B